MKWELIESAPKEDWIPVLVYCRANREPMQEDPDEIHVAFWHPRTKSWEVSSGYMNLFPTHWMPVPDAP